MYVCVCIYVYMYVCVCIYVCIYVCVYVCVCMYVYVSVVSLISNQILSIDVQYHA